jgi:hypothetical protein
VTQPVQPVLLRGRVNAQWKCDLSVRLPVFNCGTNGIPNQRSFLDSGGKFKAVDVINQLTFNTN